MVMATPPPAMPATVGVYIFQTFGAWDGPVMRPPYFSLGTEWGIGWPGGSGIPRGPMRWTTWRASGKGYGTGEFWEYSRISGNTDYSARVTLSDVRVHNGRHYFSVMKIAGNGHGNVWLKYYAPGTGPYGGTGWYRI
jgi:hypothetical protein